MTASAWCEKGSDCNVEILLIATAGPKRPVAGGFLHLVREGGRSLAQQPVFAGLPHTLRSLEGSLTGRRANGGEAHFRENRLFISCTIGICDARLHRRVMASFRGGRLAGQA